jgi:hypothetical protein
MKKVFWSAIILLMLTAPVFAAFPGGGGTFIKEGAIQAIGDNPIMPPNYTVATLPTPDALAVGALAWVTDGDSATDCVTGLSTNKVLCYWTGSAWSNVDTTGGVGTGSLTTLQENDVGVGGADIVTLDFGTGFSLAENPDKEVNVTLDVTPSSGNATLIIEEDAIQVKYDSTDFAEGASGLTLSATPTIATSISLGADPADNGSIRLSNNTSIQFENSTPGTDVNAFGVDASEVIQIGLTGASGVTIFVFGCMVGHIYPCNDRGAIRGYHGILEPYGTVHHAQRQR